MTSALLLNNKSSELNSFFSISEKSEKSTSKNENNGSAIIGISELCKSSHQLANMINQNFNEIERPKNLDISNIDNNDISTSKNKSSIVQNLRHMISTNLSTKNSSGSQSQPSVEIPIVHVNQNTGSTGSGSGSSCSQFIDPTELKNKFYEFSSKFLLILLDCRTYNDFNLKHIKDSVHLNCRDRLTRKRLQSRKLTVKDLISCEEIKNKFEEPCVDKTGALNNLVNIAVTQAEVTNDLTTNIQDNKNILANPNNMIVLYDEKTSDFNDLQSDQNPLKIVQENIKQSGYKKDCKILKGGFKSFFEMCPEFCILKDGVEQQRAFFNKHKEYFKEITDDQRQSAIDNAVMTEITPYIFLGNESDAKNIEKLEKKGIYYILNVTKNIPFYNSTNTMTVNSINTNNGPFVYKRIAVNDCENQNLKNFFDEAFDFIDQAKLKNQKVLVHCQAGISRSPTIVIAYLMSRFNLEMNDAYNQVKIQRPIIGPNLIFMSQLMDYDTNLKNMSKTITPINVVHTVKSANLTNNFDNFNNNNVRNTLSAPPSTPILQGTQIDVHFINTNKNSENSENNSPDAIIHSSNSSNSYFKLAHNVSANNNTCINNSDAILVFN